MELNAVASYSTSDDDGASRFSVLGSLLSEGDKCVLDVSVMIGDTVGVISKWQDSEYSNIKSEFEEVSILDGPSSESEGARLLCTCVEGDTKTEDGSVVSPDVITTSKV